MQNTEGTKTKGQARIIELLEENNRLTEKLFARMKALDRKIELAVKVGGGLVQMGPEVEDALTRINRRREAQEDAAEHQNPSTD